MTMATSRRCTDVPGLVIFLAAVGLWICLGIYAINMGQPNTLMQPKDSMGARCDVDQHVEGKPYLFFFDIATCDDLAVPLGYCSTPHICVESCPNEVFLSTKEADLKKKKLYCLYDTTVWDPQKCSKWYLPSYHFQGRCVPYQFTDQAVLKNISDIREQLTTSTVIDDAVEKIKMLTQVRVVSQGILRQIMESWWRILIGVLLSLMLCFIYMFILTVIPIYLIWFSLTTMLAFIIFYIYFSVRKYLEYRDSNGAVVETKAFLWLCSIIISSVLLGYILIALLFSRKSFLKWISLASEGAKLFHQIPSVWLFPFVFWLFQMGLIIFAFSVGVHLATDGTPMYHISHLTDKCRKYLEEYFHRNFQEESKCEPKLYKEAVLSKNDDTCISTHCEFIGMRRVVAYPYLQAFNIVVFLWMISFTSALEEMVLSFMFASWYFSSNKEKFYGPLAEALKVTLGYHVGTLAFGSALIALYRHFLLKVLVNFVDRKSRTQGFVGHYCLFFTSFFLLLSERFLIHITSYAYIFSCMYGENFCKSAKASYELISRYSYKFDRQSIGFLLFLLELWITMIVGLASFVLFGTNWIMDNSGLNFPFVIILVIALCAYLTAMAFFSVNEDATQAIFVCIVADFDANNALNDEDYKVPAALVGSFIL